jgi:hypothetical protein
MSILLNKSTTTPNLPERILETDDRDFRNKFNQKSFEFSHNLAEHPLFEIPRLVELANTIASKHDRNKVVCLSSNLPPDRKWSDMTPDIKGDVTFSGVMRFKELFKYIGKSLGK